MIRTLMWFSLSSVIALQLSCVQGLGTLSPAENQYSFSLLHNHEYNTVEFSDEELFHDNHAWFSGADRVIRYCIKTSEIFPLKAEEIKPLIDQSFDHWAQYIMDKRVNESPRPEELYLATKHSYVESCEQDHELKFVFGGELTELIRFSDEFSNPMAVAIRTFFDPNKAWGKGFIWVPETFGMLFDGKPVIDWATNIYGLKIMIMHELGHVFGNGHQFHTVMDHRIYRLPLGFHHQTERYYDERASLEASSIDRTQELVSRPLEKTYQTGWFEDFTSSPLGKFRPQTFVDFFGKSSAGEVKAKVNLNDRVIFVSDESGFEASLTWRELLRSEAGTPSQNESFKVLKYSTKFQRSVFYAEKPMAFTVLGELSTPMGVFPISLSYNHKTNSGSIITMRYRTSDGDYRLIFENYRHCLEPINPDNLFGCERLIYDPLGWEDVF